MEDITDKIPNMFNRLATEEGKTVIVVHHIESTDDENTYFQKVFTNRSPEIDIDISHLLELCELKIQKYDTYSIKWLISHNLFYYQLFDNRINYIISVYINVYTENINIIHKIDEKFTEFFNVMKNTERAQRINLQVERIFELPGILYD